MLDLFPCAYLDADVELSEERRRQIRARHPELAADLVNRILETLEDPGSVIRSGRSESGILFVRGYDRRRGRIHAVVVVVLGDIERRPWIVTTYLARGLPRGKIEWQRT